jgi:hypothetical protein
MPTRATGPVITRAWRDAVRVGFSIFVVIAMAQSAKATPWSFAFFCDSRTDVGENGGRDGVNMIALHAIAADVAQEKVSLVIFPGDLVNGGPAFGPLEKQLATWKEAMAPIYDEGIPVYPCRGNHELKQDMLRKGISVSAWRAAFPTLPRNGPAGEEGLTYSVDYANATFIAGDDFIGIRPTYDRKRYDSTVNVGMVSPWVIEQVKTSKKQWVFAFGHESAFIGHHLDCLANFPEERDSLWDALGAKRGVYLSGHDHMYLRHTAPDSSNRPVLELVDGCAGATPYEYDNAALNAGYDRHVVPTCQFVNAKPGAIPNTRGLPMRFGYVLVTVDGAMMTGQWRAFMNYDTNTYSGPTPPEQPRFETLDTFSWP